MNIKQNILAVFKTVSSAIIGFFTKEEEATKSTLRGFDSAEIFIALLPAAIFGCLVFEKGALLNLAVCVILSVGLDLLWNLIFKKQNKVDFSAAVCGLVAGLTLSSRLNIFITVGVNIAAFALRKTVFKDKPMQIFAPWFLARAVFAVIFFKAFTTYAIPFISTTNGTNPVDGMLNLADYTYPAKYLFFGVHSGNIGETSVLLLTLGGIYLIFRKIINPVIPVSFIVTSAVLSLIFGENIALSLMGGGIFIAAFFLTLDYSFNSAPLYKKLLYGIGCGALTFIMRLIFKTETVYFAVVIVHFAVIYITKRNIKRFIRFVKKPDFGKLLSKFKKAFSV